MLMQVIYVLCPLCSTCRPLAALVVLPSTLRRVANCHRQLPALVACDCLAPLLIVHCRPLPGLLISPRTDCPITSLDLNLLPAAVLGGGEDNL
jgi:hypothetical protein